MSTASAPSPALGGNPVLAIAVGGLIAGTLDLTQAMILFGTRIPLVIAGGMLDQRAFHGGAGTYALVSCCITSSRPRSRLFITQSAAV
jgi:hypothetical protein